MTEIAVPSSSLATEQAAASSPQGLVDRRELAFIAVERTRMPMVVTDPRQRDNPIVLANRAYLETTGYAADEVIGRNPRFMQGAETDHVKILEVRSAVAEEREATIELLNYRKDGSSFWNQLFLSPIHDDDGQLLYFFGSLLDITQRRRAQELEADERRLLREVDHRAKNALALVQGIVRLSRADDPEAYAEAIQGRVDALANAHAILAEGHWRDVPLDRVIHGEVTPLRAQRVQLDGPTVMVPAAQVQPLALLLHELLANAARHGALSSPDGTVSISWHKEAEDSRLIIEVREAGGPPLPADRAPGFGATMMDAIVRRQLHGSAAFDWKPGGLETILTIPTHGAFGQHAG